MPDCGLEELEQRLRHAGVRTQSVIRCAKVALAAVGPGGRIEAEQLQDLTGYSRPTVDLACKRLVGLKILAPVKRPRRGRGHKAAFILLIEKLTRDLSESSLQSGKNTENPKPPHPQDIRNKKTAINDASAKGSVSKSGQRPGRLKPEGIPTQDNVEEVLHRADNLMRLGRETAAKRLSLMALRWAGWAAGLSPGEQGILCQATGKVVWDKSDLNWLRQVKELVKALLAGGWRQIRAWVRKVVERVGTAEGRRALFALLLKRLKGTLEMGLGIIKSKRPDAGERLRRRITGIGVWLAAREREFELGQACGVCRRRHTPVEYWSGYVDDGSGRLNCMGWGRVKVGELEDALHELRKRRERKQADRCYGVIRDADGNRLIAGAS